jgi:hypothetical protein
VSKTSLKQSTTAKSGLTVHTKEGNFHLGYSRIASFQNCPRQYKYSYMDGIRKAGSVAMRRGQAYHSVLDCLLKYKMAHNELLSLEQAEKVAIRSGKAENLSNSEIYRVIDATRFWYSEMYPKLFPAGVEQDFEINRGGVKLTGRIDDVELCGRVIDHKFSYDKWAQPRAKFGCQPIVYQWAALDYLTKKFKNWQYTGFSYHIIRLFPTPLIQEIDIDPIPQWESDWYEEQIAQIAACVQAGLFPARPADKECTLCSHTELCQPAIWNIRTNETNPVDTNDSIDNFEDC